MLVQGSRNRETAAEGKKSPECRSRAPAWCVCSFIVLQGFRLELLE